MQHRGAFCPGPSRGYAGQRRNGDIWLLLLSCAAVLGVFCLYRRAARAVGAKLTKADAVILGICIAASAAFYLHAMVGRQSLYLWDNATYYNLQVRLESNFADGVFTGVGPPFIKPGSTTTRRWSSTCWPSRFSCSRPARPTPSRCSVRC
ncbi:MAG: hypothetical protein ACLUFT_12325 [Gemmiger formicilis]|uniref:hypothetical protein n=1 Tax=Gemmiger formicilis TaxID=745368 RepID=UPI003991063B